MVYFRPVEAKDDWLLYKFVRYVSEDLKNAFFTKTTSMDRYNKYSKGRASIAFGLLPAEKVFPVDLC